MFVHAVQFTREINWLKLTISHQTFAYNYIYVYNIFCTNTMLLEMDLSESHVRADSRQNLQTNLLILYWCDFDR